MTLNERLEVREGTPARGSPEAVEVEQNDLALVVREFELVALEGGPGEVDGLGSDGDVLLLVRLEELLASLLARGIVVWGRDGRRLKVQGRIDELRLPPSMDAVLRSRVESIDAAPRRGLFAASVLGRRFRVRELASLEGDRFRELEAMIGPDEAAYRLESSRMKKHAIDDGFLRPTHIRGRKPNS